MSKLLIYEVAKQKKIAFIFPEVFSSRRMTFSSAKEGGGWLMNKWTRCSILDSSKKALKFLLGRLLGRQRYASKQHISSFTLGSFPLLLFIIFKMGYGRPPAKHNQNWNIFSSTEIFAHFGSIFKVHKHHLTIIFLQMENTGLFLWLAVVRR